MRKKDRKIETTGQKYNHNKRYMDVTEMRFLSRMRRAVTAESIHAIFCTSTPLTDVVIYYKR